MGLSVVLERAGRPEGNFKEGPAIHARHVHAGRLDPVVELERVILVRGSHQERARLCVVRSPTGKLLPVLAAILD